MMEDKRRVLLINKSFQLKFIGYALIPNLICIAIFYAAEQMYFENFYKQGEDLGLPKGHPYFVLLSDQQVAFNHFLLGSALFMTLFFICWGLFVSNKIAGPFARLTSDLKSSGGGAESFHFRPGDFFQEVPEALNSFLRKRSVIKDE